MSDRRGLLGDTSWFQLAASVLASVTAAWLASRLGVAGTLIGAALGSAVITITTAFYGRTLDKGKTLLVTTASGTIVQRQVEDGQIAETLEQAAEETPVESAEVVEDETPSPLRWKTIVITTAVVLALALATITAIELVSHRTLDGSKGTTLGDTFGGQRGTPAPDEPGETPSSTSPTASTPTKTRPTPTRSTAVPTPTRTTRPTPTPTASQPTEPPE